MNLPRAALARRPFPPAPTFTEDLALLGDIHDLKIFTCLLFSRPFPNTLREVQVRKVDILGVELLRPQQEALRLLD